MTTQAATDDEYITLESSDKFIFVIHRDVATLSGTIKNMLSSGNETFPPLFFGGVESQLGSLSPPMHNHTQQAPTCHSFQ